MQAIQTKYLGTTDRRGSRVKATAWAGSATVEWDPSIDSDRNHIAAACALIKKLGWDHRARDGRWEMGWLADGTCVHVARS